MRRKTSSWRISRRLIRVRWIQHGTPQELVCDFVAGCDGYHGVSRASVDPDRIVTHERAYPFGWLGVLAEVPRPRTN